jgi:hypothetical protein
MIKPLYGASRRWDWMEPPLSLHQLIVYRPIAQVGGLGWGYPDRLLKRLRAEIAKRVAAGAIVVPMDITPADDNPWGQVAGMFRNDPQFDEWQDAMSQFRRQVDQDVDPL